MDRRKFSKVMGVAVVGMVAGSKLTGRRGEVLVADDKAAKHVCKGHNECKGQGACAIAENGCAGQNSCKGKGGCATVAKHSCKGQNECKGQGKDGKNSCRGQGTCATAKEHSCGAQNDCKALGGCGETVGANECKGKGLCHVPLMTEPPGDSAWDKLRKKKEAEWADKKLEAGPAPAKAA